MSTPPQIGRGQLVRDVLVLQGKLLLDGARDLLLVPVSLIAGLVSWLHSGRGAGLTFYEVVRLARRSERWIDLFAAADRLEPSRSASPEPTLDELLERIESGLLEQYRQHGGRLGAAQLHEALAIVRRRLARSRRDAGGADAPPAPRD